MEFLCTVDSTFVLGAFHPFPLSDIRSVSFIAGKPIDMYRRAAIHVAFDP